MRERGWAGILLRGKTGLIFLFFFFFLSWQAKAQVIVPRITLGVGTAQNPQEISASLQVLAILTVLSIAPALLILMTSFTRFVIVLSFVRYALGVQQVPPNQVLLAFALFMTMASMTPVLVKINREALKPYMANQLSLQEAGIKSLNPLRDFMFRHTREKDLALFLRSTGTPPPSVRSEVPTLILIPSFALSELRTAFQMGFVLFIAFLVIDMVVASVLMSMGMFMLPPMMISLPIKIMLFVLADGWYLVVQSLLDSVMK